MTNLALVVSLLLKGPMLESGGHDLGYQVYDGLFNEVVRLDRAADAAWTQCASPAALAERQSEVRNKVIEAIGGFPERTPLNAKTTGVVERDGCKIEKVLFESRPGHFVTAHLFLPDTARYAPPWPGVVVPCGHSLAGKRAPYYQRAGLAGARAGLATLIYDPIEQGERRQRDDKGWKGSVKGHNHIGHRAHLLGWSTAQFRIWDGMRACDYIASRSDVDAGRIGVTGMSGGGTLSAYLNALDSRFCAAAPSGFISTIRDVYDNLGPQDAEQVVFGQAAFGFNHLGIVSLRAPSPLLVVATHGDYFPFMGSLETFANAKKVYSLLGAEGNVALMESAGPHGWYESTRAAAMLWLKRWTAHDEAAWPPDFTALRRLDLGFAYTPENSALAFDKGADGNVTPTGRVLDLPGSHSVFDILREELSRLDDGRNKLRLSLDDVRAVTGIRPLSSLGSTCVAGGSQLIATNSDARAVRCILSRNDDLTPIPFRAFIPARSQGEPVLIVSDRKAETLADEVTALAEAGRIVAVADLRGFGETAKGRHPFYGAKRPDEELAVMAMTIGENLVARRSEDAALAALHLAILAGTESVALKAHGAAAIPAAHAFALERRLFSSFEMSKAPSSWHSVVEDSTIAFSFADSVYGALKVYDWIDLAKE